MALDKVELLNETGVTPGSYTNANITVDADGRLTLASNGSSGSPIPPMGVGGVTANPYSQIFFIGGANGALGTGGGLPIYDPSIGGQTSGFTQPFDNTALGRVTWVNVSQAWAGGAGTDFGPLVTPQGQITVSPNYLCQPYFDGNPWGGVYPTLVFENVYLRPQFHSVVFTDIAEVYGGFFDASYSAGSLAASLTGNLLTAWYYGRYKLYDDFSFSCPLLTEVSTCRFELGSSKTFNASTCPLNAASVDSILVNAVAQSEGANQGWTINLGGSCSAPTAIGLAAKATLISDGMTVITN